MHIKLNNWTKAALVLICLIASIIGFMVKLPRSFRGHDKEMHAAFYFLAAAFLNILFSKGKLTWHILIFILLYLFSISIEYAQEWSNKFFRVKIHGRYDPEDVKWNLKGLVAFSAVWVVYTLGALVFRKAASENNQITPKNN